MRQAGFDAGSARAARAPRINTYTHYGLPPGPIVLPSISGMESVLNYEKHKYLYFCAKEDFSGYHNFAKTLAQHNKNRAKYRAALNKRDIYK